MFTVRTNPAGDNGIVEETAADKFGGPEVVAVVESATIPLPNPNEYVSSKGIKFKIKKIPKLALVDAGKRLKDPKVPMFYNEDKERNEPNPNDPNYIDELRDVNYQRGIAITSVGIVLGTELIKPLPEDVEAPEDTDWSDALNELGIEIPEKGRMRYLAWVKYYALDDEEFTILFRTVAGGAGMVFAEEVAEATVAFPGNEARNTDTGTSA